MCVTKPLTVETIKLNDGTTIQLLILPSELGMTAFASGEMHGPDGDEVFVAALNIRQLVTIRLIWDKAGLGAWELKSAPFRSDGHVSLSTSALHLDG